MNTRIEKAKLLEILTANRNEHHAIFEEAVEGYRKKATELLNQNLDSLKANRHHRVSVYLQIPEDHTKDYDRIIKMIEMTSDDFITLQEQDFKSYVMDDWQWSDQFYGSNSVYSAGAAAKMRAFEESRGEG